MTMIPEDFSEAEYMGLQHFSEAEYMALHEAFFTGATVEARMDAIRDALKVDTSVPIAILASACVAYHEAIIAQSARINELESQVAELAALVNP